MFICITLFMIHNAQCCKAASQKMKVSTWHLGLVYQWWLKYVKVMSIWHECTFLQQKKIIQNSYSPPQYISLQALKVQTCDIAVTSSWYYWSITNIVHNWNILGYLLTLGGCAGDAELVLRSLHLWIFECHIPVRQCVTVMMNSRFFFYLSHTQSYCIKDYHSRLSEQSQCIIHAAHLKSNPSQKEHRMQNLFLLLCNHTHFFLLYALNNVYRLT